MKPKFDAEAFKSFLTAHGYQVLAPTNDYEVVRFRSGNGTGIIYQDKRKRLTFTPEAQRLYDAKIKGLSCVAPERTPRIAGLPRTVVPTLLARDGPNCFYCGQAIPFSHISVEHLLSKNAGGNDHLSNLALAHKACNRRAGHLSVAEKVELRDRRRAENGDAGANAHLVSTPHYPMVIQNG